MANSSVFFAFLLAGFISTIQGNLYEEGTRQKVDLRKSSRTNVGCYHMNWNTSVVLDGTDLPTTGQQVNTENEPVEGDYSQLCNTGPGQSCVKYILTNRDETKSTAFVARFCAKGMANHTNSIITSGCHTQPLTGVDLTVCFCSGDRCNKQAKPSSPLASLIVTILIALLII